MKNLTEEIKESFSFEHNRIYKTILAIIGSYVLIPIQISENLTSYFIFGAPFVLCFYGLFYFIVKGIIDNTFTKNKGSLFDLDKNQYQFINTLNTKISNKLCILCFSIIDVLIILPKEYFSWK